MQKVARMMLFYDAIRFMLCCVHLCHCLMVSGIKRLSHGLDPPHAVAAEDIEQRLEHHADTFDDRFAVGGPVFDGPFQVVDHW